MSCSICTNSLHEEPDDLMGGVNSGWGPSATSGGGGNGPSTSRGGRGPSDEESLLCVTTCGHIYHRACIGHWLDAKTRNRVKTCPLCQRVIAKRGLRPVYLDGLGGMEETERRLKDEVEEKTRRLNESKLGQREMSRRIDELFEENEKLKRKNRAFEGVTRTSDCFWQSMDDRNRELEDNNRELKDRIRELVKNRKSDMSGELAVRNRELSERNQVLTFFWDGGGRDDLEVAEMRCAEAEEKYVNLRAEMDRMIGGNYFR